MLDEKTDIKKLYRLAVEYLKESKEYKYICTIEEKIGENEFWDRLLDLLRTDEASFLDQNGRSISRDELYNILCNLNHEYKAMTGSLAIETFARKMAKRYHFFINIHAPNYNFEKWWREYGINFIQEEKPEAIIVLDEMLLALYGDKIFNSDNISEPQDRIPQINNVKKTFVARFGEKKDRVALIVNPMYPIDQLSEEFMTIMKNLKIKYNITSKDEQEMLVCGQPFIISGRIVPELPTYLEVYRRRSQGMKWQEVIEIVDKKYIHADGKMDEGGRRLFRTHYEKAERIIGNVENGIFPGKYQKSKKP